MQNAKAAATALAAKSKMHSVRSSGAPKNLMESGKKGAALHWWHIVVKSVKRIQSGFLCIHTQSFRRSKVSYEKPHCWWNKGKSSEKGIQWGCEANCNQYKVKELKWERKRFCIWMKTIRVVWSFECEGYFTFYILQRQEKWKTLWNQIVDNGM